MRYLIDPLNGHAYGFPRRLEGDLATLDINLWLALNDYPKREIDLYRNRVSVAARVLGPLETDDLAWRAYE